MFANLLKHSVPHLLFCDFLSIQFNVFVDKPSFVTLLPVFVFYSIRYKVDRAQESLAANGPFKLISLGIFDSDHSVY